MSFVFHPEENLVCLLDPGYLFPVATNTKTSEPCSWIFLNIKKDLDLTSSLA